MQEKRIQIYDSMGSGGHRYLEALFQYLKDEYKDKKKSPLPEVDEWKLIPTAPETPRQRNGKSSFIVCYGSIDATNVS
jgi:Ulp1 family protease